MVLLGSMTSFLAHGERSAEQIAVELGRFGKTQRNNSWELPQLSRWVWKPTPFEYRTRLNMQASPRWNPRTAWIASIASIWTTMGSGLSLSRSGNKPMLRGAIELPAYLRMPQIFCFFLASQHPWLLMLQGVDIRSERICCGGDGW